MADAAAGVRYAVTVGRWGRRGVGSQEVHGSGPSISHMVEAHLTTSRRNQPGVLAEHRWVTIRPPYLSENEARANQRAAERCD
jgi:hypothetical protein